MASGHAEAAAATTSLRELQAVQDSRERAFAAEAGAAAKESAALGELPKQSAAQSLTCSYLHVMRRTADALGFKMCAREQEVCDRGS